MRIRIPGDFLSFARYPDGAALPAGANVGDFIRIPQGTEVSVDGLEIVRTGASGAILFAHAISRATADILGWTSTRNFAGKFVNETLGELPPQPDADQTGPNAAWVAGAFSRQLTLVQIVDARLEIERIAEDTLEAYLNLVAAAAADGVQVAINSAFRSYPEQNALYQGYINGIPGYNLAAKPGRSNHQNGIAFDIAVAGGAGNPTYDWLTQNAPQRGFVRTVNNEPWHWEYDPDKAAVAVAANTFKTSSVKV